ncbi:MAG: Gfo/Idh/MocA family oxidoreductase [Chitinivibrionales bacterium]|nr:Gfo/Idh/MocA family oxidoreductase [Chitinivibrionales bacterium]
MRHLNWGIIGAARIAKSFVKGLQTIDSATALAVGSRSLEKARGFAAENKIERAYGSYEEVLRDKEVNAVYIGLPNSMHAEWSIKAANAGKHILCEKPAVSNAAEMERVLKAVKKNDVFFIEAFMYRCHPQWQQVRQIIDSGVIGDVRVLHAAFAFNMGDKTEDVRLSNPLAGGGLMDVGCYCVSFCRLIAQEEPLECSATAVIGPRSRVDELGSAVLKFPSGIVASCIFGIECHVPIAAQIYGSKGHIIVTTPWFPSDDNATIIVTAEGKTETFSIKTGRNLYASEALTVAEYVDKRQAPAMSWDDSLGQARTLDALRTSMGLHWDFEKKSKRGKGQ